MVLKRYRRGSILLLTTLTAISVIVTVAVRQALAVVDRINSGDVALDPGAITNLVSQSGSGADSTMVNIAVLVMGVCWVLGIVDSCRLAGNLEKEDRQAAPPEQS